jgi:hypothetical protein
LFYLSEKCNLLNQRSQEIKCSSFTKRQIAQTYGHDKNKGEKLIGFTKSRMAKFNIDASPKANKKTTFASPKATN